MKISIVGAAGVRTPLIIQSILSRQSSLGLTDLSLMDIDAEHLELIGAITTQIEATHHNAVNFQRTTDPVDALRDADFVITTFRVGGIESRLIDEQVPLQYGVLGQETTGPGGFAMGIRSIPVLLGYVKLMQQLCPNAWLINFANPAGMLTEAVLRQTDWKRVVGICDAPSTMHRVIAAQLSAKCEDVFIDYFGLNHLGWIRKVTYQQQDFMPDLMNFIGQLDHIPGLPFDPKFVLSLGLIPNEYLYYYYYAQQAIHNIQKSGECRAAQLIKLNHGLFTSLREQFDNNDISAMQRTYQAYLTKRGETYMMHETGISHTSPDIKAELREAITDEGYAGVALNLIEALRGDKPSVQILNIPNSDAIEGFQRQDVVEIPADVRNNQIQPLPVAKIPDHCLGLMKQVKQYEQLTIEACADESYDKALLALTIHPLVRDYTNAKAIVDEYKKQHGAYFPKLI